VSQPKILFIGPGAIGASLAAWVAEAYPADFVMGHGASQATLRQFLSPQVGVVLLNAARTTPVTAGSPVGRSYPGAGPAA